MPRILPRQKGTVAVVAALTMVVLLIIAGGVIDIARAMYTRSVMQSALDAGVLAAGANPRLDDTGSKAIITNHVKGNTQKLPIDSVSVTYAKVLRPDGEVLIVSADAGMDTIFMRIFGKDRLALHAKTEVRRAQPGPVQVVLVLDSTASMGLALGSATRLDALKEAAKELTNVIMDPPNDGGGIGLVPFSLFVNLNLVTLGGSAATWVNVPANVPVCNYSPRCYASCIRDGAPAQCLNTSLPGCVVSNCRTQAFDGCVSYRSRPYRTTIAGQSTNKHRGVIAVCAPPSRAIMNTKSTIITNINALHTVAVETHIPAGLMWGWNMLTPDLPIAGPSKSDVEDKGGRRAIILISDGENRNRPADSNNGFFTTWLPGTPTVYPEDDPDLLTAAICDNITDATNDPKIEIYTVLIGAQSASMVTLMENCASDTTKAFTATTRSGLVDVFKLIGQQLTPVRLNK